MHVSAEVRSFASSYLHCTSLDRLRRQVPTYLLQLLKGGAEVFGDLVGDYVRQGEGGGVLNTLVSEPEDVEVGLVALDQLGVGEAAKAVFRLVAGCEVVQVGGGKAAVAARKVGLDGLEPTTSVLSGPRSNRLSYRPTWGGGGRLAVTPGGRSVTRGWVHIGGPPQRTLCLFAASLVPSLYPLRRGCTRTALSR